MSRTLLKQAKGVARQLWEPLGINTANGGKLSTAGTSQTVVGPCPDTHTLPFTGTVNRFY